MKVRGGIAGWLLALAGWMPSAQAVDLSFEVYEMPRPTLEALGKYLDAGGEGARAAYGKLAGMGGVKELSALKVSTPSGVRIKADSGGALVGDEAWMGVAGLNLEIDPLVSKSGEVDLNLVLKFLQVESGKISEYNLITSVSFPPDQPVALQAWIEEAKARVLFVTATGTGEFRPDLSDAAMVRVELETVELGSSREAGLLVDQGDAPAVAAARREGHSRLHHVMHARSGQRMQSRAGSGTSRQFPEEMDEFQLELTPTWGADRSEISLRADLLSRKGGAEKTIGGGQLVVSRDGEERLFALEDANGGGTPFVMIVRTSVYQVGTMEPKVAEASAVGAVPEPVAKDPANLFVGIYPVTADFIDDLVKKHFKGRDRIPAAEDLLSAAGMVFPPGSSAFFNPDKGTITLRQNAAGHEMMRGMIGP